MAPSKQKTISSFFSKDTKRKGATDVDVSSKKQKTDGKCDIEAESRLSRFLNVSGGGNKAESKTVDETTPINSDGNDRTDFAKVTPSVRPKKESPPSEKEPTGSKSVALKPYQQQLRELKLKYKDTVLFIEEGYRYKVLGKDAEIVSKLGGLMLKRGRLYAEDGHEGDEKYSEFAHCVFLSQSLKLYIEKMIRLGHKVGVVNQMETAAIKAAGDNKGQPMERKLTQLYTPGTYINIEGSSSENDDEAVSGFFMAICEVKEKAHNHQKFGMVAVQVSTGRILYDEFKDNPILNELKTRLLHIRPCEVLLIGESIGINATQLIRNALTQVRINTAEFHKASKTASFLNEYYSSVLAQTSDVPKVSELIKMVNGLPDSVKSCFHCLIEYLTEFRMESIFNSPQNFAPFNSNLSMLLNANSLTSLEIFHNSTDHSTKGSLFEVLDHTNTPYGKRLLKSWVGRPLIEKEQIEERVSAVTELKSNYSKDLDHVLKSMKHSSIDVEKGITNIYYHKSSRRQVFFVLKELEKFTRQPMPKNYKSKLLNGIFEAIPKCRPTICKLLERIDEESIDLSLKDLRMRFFKDDEYDNIFLKNSEVAQVLNDLDNYLNTLKDETELRDLEYVNDKESDFLIRVKKKDVKRVPDSWMKFSQTKDVVRYSSAETRSMASLLELKRDELGVECDRAFNQFMGEIREHYEELRSAVNALSQLDCLFSLTAVAHQPHFVRASYVNRKSLKITEGIHPITQYRLKSSYIPNNISITENCDRTMIITGPNMGGKSSYVRQIALITIMAQIGSYVPAANAEIGIVDAIYTRMGAYDNLLTGESTFMVELQECGAIMKNASENSLVILDEVGRGTSTMDGAAIARAVLSYFIMEKRSRTLFITHYPMITALASVFPGVATNYHMGYQEYFNGDYTEVVFLYKLVKGVSKGSYGLNVARISGLPEAILSEAKAKSDEKAMEMARNQNERTPFKQAKFLQAVLKNPRSVSYSEIIDIMETLETEI